MVVGEGSRQRKAALFMDPRPFRTESTALLGPIIKFGGVYSCSFIQKWLCSR